MLCNDVGTQRIITLHFILIPVLISVIPVKEFFIAPILIIHCLVCWYHPWISKGCIVIITLCPVLIINAVHTQGCCQPFGNVIAAFVINVDLFVTGVNNSLIILFVIDYKVAIEVVSPGTYGKVVLLENLPQINSICILLRKIVLTIFAE